MLFPFKSSIVLAVEGEKIDTELLLVPMWHLSVAYISIGSLVLLIPCSSAIDALQHPTLPPIRAKWIPFHQFLISWFATCNSTPLPFSNKTQEITLEWDGRDNLHATCPMHWMIL